MAKLNTHLSEVNRHEDIVIPVQGEEVAANRYEPVDYSDQQPAILIATPYRKDDRITFGAWDPSIQYLAKHGYEVVVVDLIGTGASSGSKEPFSGEEGDELAEVIEWLADQEWCDGNVGMYGLSYGGFTQWQAASSQPAALKAIVPIAVTPVPYESSYTGGTFNPLKRATWASQMTAFASLPPSRRDDNGRWAKIWQERLRDLDNQKPWLFHFRENDTKNKFWQKRDIHPEEIQVPTFVACGTRDVHTLPMVEFFSKLDVPKRMVLGPWRHNMPEQGIESSIDFRRQAVEWLDHFLKGDNNGALDHHTVEYWTERAGGWSEKGIWRGSDNWPRVEENSSLSFLLTPEGAQRGGPYDSNKLSREYRFDQTVGMHSLHRILGHSNSGSDTNPDDVRSLIFETDPLSEPIEATGTGKATIRIRPETEDALVSVRVTDVDPNGYSRLVTSGYLKLSHRDSNQDTEKLVPGEEYEVEIPLHPKSHIFEETHKIRVSIGSALFPRALPVNNHGSFTILSSANQPSKIEIPGKVHEGGVQFDDTVQMNSADDNIPVHSEYVYNTHSNLETTRNDENDTATFNLDSSYSIDLPHADEMTINSEVQANVAADDPSSFYLRDDTEIELEYKTESIKVCTTSRIGLSYSLLSTETLIDGQRIYKNTWRSLPE